jgi:hypothetical protein
MDSRRTFLKQTAAGFAASAILVPGRCTADSEVTVRSQDTQIPDTLDLGTHGALALQGILGSLNTNLNYESVFLHILDVHPAYMLHWSTMVSGVMPKYVEALPMLRIMSGDRDGMDVQNGFMEAMLANAAEDGLVYDRASKDRPWNVGVFYGNPDWNEDYASMFGNSRYLSGLTFWHQATGNPEWKDLARKTAERMHELAIVEGDYAWYPNPGCGNDFSYPRESGWTTTQAPASIDEGYEPRAALGSLSQVLRGFSRYYQMTGDERFPALSRKFVNFINQKKFWGDVYDQGTPAGEERGHFQGHFHASLSALRSLLDHAIVADDLELKLKIRDGYEWARQRGIHRLGIFSHDYEMTEGCTIADMVGLAVALTDAGLGDYWDDVDMYTRNGLVSAQATDLEELQRVSEEGKLRPPQADWGGLFDSRFASNNKGVLPGQEIHDRALQRALGTFGHLCGCQYLVPQSMSCCTANGAQALYYAWEGILRVDGDTGEVNLWMNRRSPWLDVWSSLPYEGRLTLQNKDLNSVAIRKPAWVRRSDVRCRMNGSDVEGRWVGNRLVLGSLKGNERIEVSVPLEEETSTHTLVNLNSPEDSKEQYRCVFKGGSAISVEETVPGGQPNGPYYGEHNWYRLFRREEMKSPETPTKNSHSYIHPQNIVKWTLV